MESANKFYYFAYGSNLSKEQTQTRCNGALPIGKAILKNYQLCFEEYRSRWGGGAATITKKPAATTMGILYSFTKENITQMDSYESVYQKIKVTIENYPKLDVYTYLKPARYSLPPSISYLTRIIQGYLEFNLDFSLLETSLKKCNFIGKALFVPSSLEKQLPKPEAKLLLAKSQLAFKKNINGKIFFYTSNLKLVLEQLEKNLKTNIFTEKDRFLSNFILKNSETIPAWYYKSLL